MEQAAEWYALLISGEDSAEDRSQWEAWLAASPDHRQAWSYVEAISQRVLAPLQDTAQPRHLADNLHAANVRTLQRRRVLAGIALLTGSGLLGWVGWRHTPLGGYVMAWAADYHTATGEIREVALPDGTHVWLNTASAFNKDYRADLRRLHLVEGEILIATAADAARPFVVDTTQGRLRALGTRFTVRQEEGQAFLAVYHGAVEIRTADSGASAVISAGQQARFTADAIQTPMPADPAREAWSRGELVVLDVPLAEVVKELNRYTRQHIGVDPTVAQRRIFGTFPLRDVDVALGLLADAAHLQIRRRMSWWITLEAADTHASGSA
ncbi:FecR domain-containing protein [Achromobacter aloeverae]